MAHRNRAVVALYVALSEAPTWTEPALARRLGVRLETLTARLADLAEAGCPVRRRGTPPNVEWSLARGWVPTDLALDGSDLRAALRLLVQLPQSLERDRLLARLLRLPSEPGPRVVESDAPPTSLSFVVRAPESSHPFRFARDVVPLAGGAVRVLSPLEALDEAARVVVSLGRAAVAESPLLAERVLTLAKGSLEAHAAASRRRRRA